MDIKKILKQLKKEIDWRLADFFNQKIRQFKKLSPVTNQMVKEIRDFTVRDGKRIRPILVYYGYLAAGGRNKKAILDACLFAELLHSYLLIHDDIIDRDKFRRGDLTVHEKYSEKYLKNSKDFRHLGLCGGILAGDLVATFAYEILAGSDFPPKLKNRASERLNQVLKDVISGQVLDIFSGIGRQLSQKDILKIMEYKTARYTIEGPLQIGAILAGANKKTLQTLSQYALPLGLAFQLKDDILGMFGDEKKTGKSVGSDLREGKQSLLIARVRKVANQKQKKIINQVLGNQNLTQRQLRQIRKIIIDTGSLKYSQDLAKKLAEQVKLIIEQSNFSKEVKNFLSNIPNYIIEREK